MSIKKKQKRYSDFSATGACPWDAGRRSINTNLVINGNFEDLMFSNEVAKYFLKD